MGKMEKFPIKIIAEKKALKGLGDGKNLTVPVFGQKIAANSAGDKPSPDRSSGNPGCLGLHIRI